jgi:3-Oxoacyl-[acyl-carrier-protein (ACP)] synthase III C terminal
VARGLHYVKREGPQVFKFAVRKTHELCSALLLEHGYTPGDVRLLIPHQANRRIIAATAERLGLPKERVVINLDKIRKYDGCHDSACDAGCFCERATQEGRPCTVRRNRGGLYGRGDFVEVGVFVIARVAENAPEADNWLSASDLAYSRSTFRTYCRVSAKGGIPPNFRTAAGPAL